MSGARAFTPEQAAAIEDRGRSLLLSATAGSGKTTVMVERFVRTVLDEPPERRGDLVGRILAITFTEKAALALAQRVRAAFLARGELELARRAQDASLSTIHGFCARVLRTHALVAGLDPSFEVLADEQAGRLREAAFEEAFDALVDAHGDAALDLAAAYTPQVLRTVVLGAHGELRSRGASEPRLPEPPPPPARDLGLARAQLADAAHEARVLLVGASGKRVEQGFAVVHACAELLERLRDAHPSLEQFEAMTLGNGAKLLKDPVCERFREAAGAYQAAVIDREARVVYALLRELHAGFAARYAVAKRAVAGLDFEDLELHTRDLLARRPGIAAAIRERYAAIMVDEFQDTNALQLEILDAIARENLFVVGDEFQSIYRFRHADVGLFRARRAQLAEHGAALELTANFRSHRDLLDTIDATVGTELGAGFLPLRAGAERDADGPRPLVELLVTHDQGWDGDEQAGVPPVDFGESLPRGRLWRMAEARLLAQRVRDLLDTTRYAPRDVALLLRATGDMQLFERALEDQGIPTYLVGGRGYWSHPQVRDLVAWLALLANPYDDLRLWEVLASPLVGLGSDALVLVSGAMAQARRTPWEVLQEAVGNGAAVGGSLGQSGAVRAGEQGAGGVEPAGAGGQGAGGVEPAGAGKRGAGAAEPAGAGAAEPAGADGAEPAGAGGAEPAGVGGTGPPGADGLLARLAARDAAALRRFVTLLTRERAAAGRRSIDLLIDRAVRATGYDLAVLAMPGGERRMANVRKLTRLAREHEAAEGRDLRAFVDRVDALAEDAYGGGREGEAPVESEDDGGASEATALDAVRIMTIHRAKGLEFPVVCVADLGRRRTAAGARVLLLGEDGDVGLRVRTLGGSSGEAFAFERLVEHETRAEAAEERRLFYVAMTRAQERLILSGATNVGSWPDPAGKTAPPISWIGPALVPGIASDLTPATPEALADHAWEGRRVAVRAQLNAVETLGAILREASLAPAPAGADIEIAPADPARLVAADPSAPVADQLAPAADQLALAADPLAPAADPSAPAADPLAPVADQLVPPAASPGQAVARVSYSSLQAFERCGYRFYLERVLRLPADRDQHPERDADRDRDATAGPASRGARGDGRAAGTVAHALLESLDLEDPRPLTDVDVAAQADAIGVPLTPGDAAAVAALLGAFAVSPLRERLARATSRRREARFAFALGDDPDAPLVTGAVDLIAAEPDRTLVVDYKTDAVGDADLAALVERAYGIQRTVYALAALADGAATVEVVHVFLERPHEPVSAVFHVADAAALRTELQSHAAGIVAGRYEVAPEPDRHLCDACPGRGTLCSWPLAATLREPRAGQGRAVSGTRTGTPTP